MRIPLKKRIKKQIGRERWIQSANIAASACNYETFSSLKNIYQGKEIAVCGAGPTLKQYQPIKGAAHIALNRALLYEKVKYDYFIADDWAGINFMQEQIIAYDCQKYLGYHCGNLNFREIPESFRIKAGGKKFYTDSYMFPSQENSMLVLDIDRMPISNTYNMGLLVMQIAFFMNPSRIYLVGIDASANGHFTDQGLSVERISKINEDLKKYVDIENLKGKWLEVKKFRDIYYPETEIVSINPVGLKGLFIDIYQTK